MKTPAEKFLFTTLTCALFLCGKSLMASDRPTGSLVAVEEFVVAGQKANLDWSIKYPAKVDPEGNPTTDSTMEIRLIGAAVGYTSGITLDASLNGEMKRFYNGYGELHPSYDITPGEIVASVDTKAGTDVEFHVYHWKDNPHYDNRITKNNGWVSTNHPDQQKQFIKLLDGDTVPDYHRNGAQSKIEELIDQYLDEDGRVSIGDNSVIITFEVYTENPNSGGFDMQDVIVLVTYK
ncbi:MAG: hypothetical protein AAGC74_03280 [Verrucomicrobiota bacterium]